MSSCLLVRLCQDTAGIQVASCVMTGIEQKSEKKVEKRALHDRGSKTETQTGSSGDLQRVGFAFYTYTWKEPREKWHAGGRECNTVCPNSDF